MKFYNNSDEGFIVAALVIVIALILVAGFLIGSAIIYFVWNALAVYFGFKTITFGIAVAIQLGLSIIGGAVRSVTK